MFITKSYLYREKSRRRGKILSCCGFYDSTYISVLCLSLQSFSLQSCLCSICCRCCIGTVRTICCTILICIVFVLVVSVAGVILCVIIRCVVIRLLIVIVRIIIRLLCIIRLIWFRIWIYIFPALSFATTVTLYVPYFLFFIALSNVFALTVT